MLLLKTISSLIVLNLLIFLTQKTVFGATNLIPNPSFEAGTGRKPENWTELRGLFCTEDSQSTSGDFFWADGKASDGNRSIGINFPLVSSFRNPMTWLSEPFTIDYPNQDFEFTFRYAGSINNNNLGLVIVLCTEAQDGDSVNFPLFRGNGRAADNDSWQEWKTRFLIDGYHPKFRSKIRVGFSNACLSTNPYFECSGSLWFDGASFVPIYRVKTHAYYDSNKNLVQELPQDWPLWKWEMKLFTGNSCTGEPVDSGITDRNGYVSLTSYSSGEHSVLEIPSYYWHSLSPICQKVTLAPATLPIINFANYWGSPAPSVPYLSQKDPEWAVKEYDSANSIGPFFCGTTIGGCGCAITSAAMVLNYHGATKAPDGPTTTPSSLNNWLKANNGYAFGAIKWNSVAAYSVKANENFGTQKIRFAGTGAANNFTLLDTDLSNSKPTILEEPGHFIVAKSKQSPTYAINDPAFSNRTTLESYSNNFLSMRRFAKTNTDLSAIYISSPAPNDIFITDSLGRKTGKDPQTGETFTEIPNSYYFLEPNFSDQSQTNSVTPPAGSGVNMLVILNPVQDTYKVTSSGNQVDFSSYDQTGEITTKLVDLPQANNPEFTLSYSPISGGTMELSQIVKIKAKVSKNKVEIEIKNQPAFNVNDIILSTITIGQNHLIPSKVKLKNEDKHKKSSELEIILKTEKNNRFLEDPVCVFGETTANLPFVGCTAS